MGSSSTSTSLLLDQEPVLPRPRRHPRQQQPQRLDRRQERGRRRVVRPGARRPPGDLPHTRHQETAEASGDSAKTLTKNLFFLHSKKPPLAQERGHELRGLLAVRYESVPGVDRREVVRRDREGRLVDRDGAVVDASGAGFFWFSFVVVVVVFVVFVLDLFALLLPPTTTAKDARRQQQRRRVERPRGRPGDDPARPRRVGPRPSDLLCRGGQVEHRGPVEKAEEPAHKRGRRGREQELPREVGAPVRRRQQHGPFPVRSAAIVHAAAAAAAAAAVASMPDDGPA